MQLTHAYTDGSAKEAIKDGGGGVYIRYSVGQCTIATGIFFTNFSVTILYLIKNGETKQKVVKETEFCMRTIKQWVSTEKGS